jgi:Flp pilus assembly pilin Flp
LFGGAARAAGRIQLVIVRVLLDDGAQGLAEYALLLGFVAVFCIASVGFLMNRLAAQVDSVSAVYP